MKRKIASLILLLIMVGLVFSALPARPVSAQQSYEDEIITLNTYIRIEDERHEEGLYLAYQLEKAGLKVNRLERDRYTCVLTAYYTDPADYAWSIYTEGWVSMSEWLYPEWSIAQMYAPWYAFMPGFMETGWWQYLNDTIDELTLKGVYGPLADAQEYWSTLNESIKLGIQESVRVFVAETWEYFPVNPRVQYLVAGSISGLWPAWPLRTANTSDGVLKVAEFSAEGALFMSAFNPVLGLEDVYTELIWRYLRDYADYPHPVSGEPIPMRDTWQVTKGGEEGITVPSDKAIIYNATEDKWVFVPSGTTAKVKVVYNISMSNWHHGQPMTIADILNEFAFSWEWATEDYEGDPYYSSKYASRVGSTLGMIKGIEIIDEDTIAIYGDYEHVVSDAVTADFYAPFAVLPWEVWAAMEYVVVNGGPVSGEEYTWSKVEGKRWIDLLAPEHVKDLKVALEKLNETGYIPNYVKELPDKYSEYVVSDTDMRARYEAALNWVDEHEHLAISNGPFYLDTWSSEARNAVLRAFRDSTYPFTADYWINYFKDYLGLDEEVNDKRRGPPLDEIRLGVKMDQTGGIMDVAEGELDIFLWSSPRSVYLGLSFETLAKLTLVKAATGYWSLLFNPVTNVYYDPDTGEFITLLNATAGDDLKLLPGLVNTTAGELKFNPFALRKVRYAINWLINRKYIVDTMLAGGGAPMYSSVQPSKYANQYFNDTYVELGLTPTGNETKAIEMIEEALLEANNTLKNYGYYLVKVNDTLSPVGYWWALRKPVEAPPPGFPTWGYAAIGVAVVVVVVVAAFALRKKPT
mgnify:CR=1 FL=1